MTQDKPPHWMPAVAIDGALYVKADDAKAQLQSHTAALSARVAELEAAQWKAIETAPRDGSYFLAANGVGVWVAHWKEFATSGYRFDNPVRSVMLNHWHIAGKDRQYLPPTHWKPLPPPPGAAIDAAMKETK